MLPKLPRVQSPAYDGGHAVLDLIYATWNSCEHTLLVCRSRGMIQETVEGIRMLLSDVVFVAILCMPCEPTMLATHRQHVRAER